MALACMLGHGGVVQALLAGGAEINTRKEVKRGHPEIGLCVELSSVLKLRYTLHLYPHLARRNPSE
jgi:hypothetical protein